MHRTFNSRKDIMAGDPPHGDPYLPDQGNSGWVEDDPEEDPEEHEDEEEMDEDSEEEPEVYNPPSVPIPR